MSAYRNSKESSVKEVYEFMTHLNHSPGNGASVAFADPLSSTYAGLITNWIVVRQINFS